MNAHERVQAAGPPPGDRHGAGGAEAVAVTTRWHAHTRRLRHSIKARLMVWFVLLALAIAFTFLAGMQRVLQGGWQGYARPLVADYLDHLAAEIGDPPDPARAAAIVARLPVSVRIEGPQVNWASGAPGRGDPDEWGLVRRTADGHRIVFGLRGAPSDTRPRLFGWATLAVLLGLTAIAYAGVRRLLAPLADITAGVEAYGRGEFGTAIAVHRDDELGALARRIDTMAARLLGMLEAKRTLLLAISHELRSPLTRARLNAELVAGGSARDALLRDLGEMRDLITSLLEGERLTQGHAALQAEPLALVPWLQAFADELRVGPDAPAVSDTPAAFDLDLGPELAAAAPTAVDPVRLKLLLRNLLANAARHAGAAAAPARLFLRREADGRLALGVRDFGPGVPDAELPRLAQAFYRPDSARARSAGGVGLGLHLCRLVAEAHGGELRLAHARPGLEVAMVWRG